MKGSGQGEACREIPITRPLESGRSVGARHTPPGGAGGNHGDIFCGNTSS